MENNSYKILKFIRIIFCSLIILFILIGNANSQTFKLLDTEEIESEDLSVFFRTTYYDNIVTDEKGTILEESSRKEFDNGVALKFNYFTDSTEIISKINQLWESDSSNFLGCFCGYDFEIFIYRKDSIYKKLKYVFCCDDLVYEKKHVFVDRNRMTEAVNLMKKISNKDTDNYFSEADRDF